MKLTSLRRFVWRMLRPLGFALIFGLIAGAVGSAQEGEAVGETRANSKSQEAIQSLLPSIVTLTRIEAVGEDIANERIWHAGVVVDPRGYIVIPLLPNASMPKLFVVRFTDNRQTVGQLTAIDESLKVGIVKIESPQPVAAISLAKSRDGRVNNRVLFLPSPFSKEVRSGQITRTEVVLGEADTPALIQTEVAFPLIEYGSLMALETGEPVGLLMASRVTGLAWIAEPACSRPNYDRRSCRLLQRHFGQRATRSRAANRNSQPASFS